VTTAGQRGDSPQFQVVLGRIWVPRLGPGRPRTRPEKVRADKAYSSRASRAYLRKRGIRCTIPEKRDQVANRKKHGSRGGRPPKFDKNEVEGAANGSDRGPGAERLFALVVPFLGRPLSRPAGWSLIRTRRRRAGRGRHPGAPAPVLGCRQCSSVRGPLRSSALSGSAAKASKDDVLGDLGRSSSSFPVHLDASDRELEYLGGGDVVPQRARSCCADERAVEDASDVRCPDLVERSGDLPATQPGECVAEAPVGCGCFDHRVEHLVQGRHGLEPVGPVGPRDDLDDGVGEGGLDELGLGLEATGISAMTVAIPVDADAAFLWDAVRDIYAVHKRLLPGAAVAVD
jgi:hypothetical protein